MNYLQLCQRLRMESIGDSGNETTVVDATGEWYRLCTWINQAWIEIQQDRADWNWMRGEASFNTIANQAEYPYVSSPISVTNFSRWIGDSFRIYKDTQGDEHSLQYMAYADFRDAYLISTYETTYSYPSVITVSPTDSLILALPPDDVYTVSGEYIKDVTELSVDADIPDLPSRYHMLIVYRAMQDYGVYESAPEVLQRGVALYEKMLNKLIFDETPEVTIDRGFC